MNQFNSEEISSKKFNSGFRGYDKSQVDSYLQILASEFKILENKIVDLETKISDQIKENEKFKSVESSLINTLKAAEDTGKDIVKNSKEDAKGILDDARKELNTIKEEYESIKLLRDNTVQNINDLKEKINSGLDIIGDEANFDEISDSIDAVEENITNSEKEVNGNKEKEVESLEDNPNENEIELEQDDKIEGDFSKDVMVEGKINEGEEISESQGDDTYELITETKEKSSDEETEDKSLSENDEESISEAESIKEENLEPIQNDSSDTSDLFPEEKQEEEENHVDELSADDIFGGKENNDEVDQPEEENDIPHDNEDDSVESQNDKLETESELEDEENESEKKKSDNAQKSFFDTFDEN
tara:strand:+ start:387 stop:1469 length:1083 start_codon:yes stop_codon:yes gene_type:complete